MRDGRFRCEVMLTDYFDIIISVLAGMLFAGMMLPVVLRTALRRHLYDKVDARKIHRGNVPRLGGLTFTPGMVMAFLSVIGINLLIDRTASLDTLNENLPVAIFGLLSLTILYGCGVADDIFGVRYRIKFGVQLICAILLIISGMDVDNLYGFLGITDLPPWVGYPFTVLLVVLLINAYNLIDGIDGLSTMLCQMAIIVYGTVFLLSGDVLGCVVAGATVGVTIPFLRYNLFGRCARGTKIFMGDTGSMTLGLVTAILGLRVLNTDASLALHDVNPALVALAPVIIPCFDVVRVYTVRIMARKSPFLPDRNHIHHRLLDLGLSARRTLACLVFTAAIVAALNILLSVYVNINIILAVDVVAWIAGTTLMVTMIRHRATSLR